MDTYTTRCTLLNRARNQNDSEAWEQLIGFYRRYIYVIIRSMNIQQQDADDILQHVLLQLWKYLPEFKYDREKSKFRYWVAKVTRNEVLQFIRKQQSHLKIMDKARAEALTSYLDSITPPEIEKLVTSEWKLFISNTAMQNIEKSFTQQALTAFKLYSQGTKVDAISKELSVKPDSVYKYISRIKLKLVEEIAHLKEELDF